MTQAWDFVDADTFWGVHDAAKSMRLCDIEWPMQSNARIVKAAYWCQHEGGWKQVQTLGEFASMTEQELARMPNLGRKSINAIKAVLAEHGLHLGM